MQQVTPTVRNLVRLLLELEGSEHAAGEPDALLGVLEKLRVSLSRLVGVAGFQALLARALALAKPQASWLETVRVGTDATLEGLDAAIEWQSAEAVGQGSAALLAQLLQLLSTFIGEALALRLVGEVWPEAQGSAAGTEETPE